MPGDATTTGEATACGLACGCAPLCAFSRQPNALKAITAPTLIMAADHDLIRDEHTVAIYHHIPNSQLAIFPNATHMIPFDDPVLFNATVERFLRTPFVKKDRINDTLKSLEKLRAAEHRQ